MDTYSEIGLCPLGSQRTHWPPPHCAFHALHQLTPCIVAVPRGSGCLYPRDKCGGGFFRGTKGLIGGNDNSMKYEKNLRNAIVIKNKKMCGVLLVVHCVNKIKRIKSNWNEETRIKLNRKHKKLVGIKHKKAWRTLLLFSLDFCRLCFCTFH